MGNNDVALKQKDNERTTAREWLVGQMTTLICVLRGTLSKDDPRWLDFGLQIPAVPSTPGAPRNLRVSRTDSGNIALDCDATPLGKTFRWRMRLAGSKDSYILVGSTSDPTLVIADPASMADLEFVVQAVNGNRQSVMSDPAVLAPLLAKKISSVESADILPVMTNGSGNRSSNGNGVHSR